jgi:protocatechuate 3,4-dioxygenase alpha subunit
MPLMLTPEGTIGPFYPGVFAEAVMPADLSVVAPILAHRPHGQAIRIAGSVTDANNQAVPSLIIEVWQANASGRYRHPLDRSDRPLDPQFDGFARIRTSDEGVYQLNTIKPGPHAVGANGVRAPHLRLTIFASGIDRLQTQIFFADEPLNEADPVLNCIAEPDRRQRLIATSVSSNEYILNIALRGHNETPFFTDWIAHP